MLLTNIIILTANLEYISKSLIHVPTEYRIQTNNGIKKITSNIKLLKDQGVLFSNPVASFTPEKYDHKDIAIWQENNIKEKEFNGLIYMKGSYEEKQLFNLMNKIMPNYTEKTISCQIQKGSNLEALIKKSSIEKIGFICDS